MPAVMTPAASRIGVAETLKNLRTPSGRVELDFIPAEAFTAQRARAAGNSDGGKTRPSAVFRR